MYSPYFYKYVKIVDDCRRELPAVWCDYSITSRRVTEILEQIVLQRGKPDQIRIDNGSEFTGKTFSAWCQCQSITFKYIQPGKPMQNTYIESFNRTYREVRTYSNH